MINRILRKIIKSIKKLYIYFEPPFTNKKFDYLGYNIGDYTYGSPGLRFYNKDECRIGKFCSIAEGTKIFGGGEHRTDWVSTYPFPAFAKYFPSTSDISDYAPSKGPTIIGNDVWIGHDVSILSGVTIGDGAVIAAKALVSRDVPPYAIVAGIPARIIRYRFSKIHIEKLLVLKWWDWDEEIITRYIHKLCNSNIADFIETAECEFGEIKVGAGSAPPADSNGKG